MSITCNRVSRLGRLHDFDSLLLNLAEEPLLAVVAKHMTEPFNKTAITFDFEHRENAKASLLIGTPVCVDDGEWRCPYQFVGFSNSRPRWIFGADATQALELAIRVAAGAFSQLDEVRNGEVTWLGMAALVLAKS